jgi:hypothetical protein
MIEGTPAYKYGVETQRDDTGCEYSLYGRLLLSFTVDPLIRDLSTVAIKNRQYKQRFTEDELLARCKLRRKYQRAWYNKNRLRLRRKAREHMRRVRGIRSIGR